MDLLQRSCVAETSPSTQERHCSFSSNTWSVFLFNCGGYHHTLPRSRQRGNLSLPQGSAAQALRWPHSNISRGKSYFSPTFLPPLIWNETLLRACSGLADPDRNSWQRTPRLACPGILKFIFKSCYTDSSWALRGLSRKGFSTRKQRKAWKYYHELWLGGKKRIKNTSFPIPPIYMSNIASLSEAENEQCLP